MLSTPRKALVCAVTAALALVSAADAADNGTANSGVQILKQYSTLYNYTSPGGVDPKLVQFSPVNFTFTNASYPSSSHNSTGDNDPTVIGVKVLEARELQPVYGVGCGVTDASSIVLQDLKKIQPNTYKDIMNLLWAQDQDEMDKTGGAGLMFTRSPLGASDFGTSVYSYDDTADCSPDEDLSLFTIERAPKMWNTHKDIQALNSDISTFWAPWSPPAWMKSEAQNCSMIGGGLLQKYEDVFAEYLAKAMSAIAQKLGKKPTVLSLQNEPLYTSDKYPGSKLDPEAAARVSKLTREKLNDAGLESVGLTAYDHNWDNPDYPIAAFDNHSSFDSVSWHCYAGSPDKQDEFTQAYPDVPQYFSECTRITQQLEEPWINLRTNAEALLIGSIEHGSRNIILWNCVLASDDNGFTSPSLPGTCRNCNAPVLIYNDNLGKMNASGMFEHPATQLSQPSTVRRGHGGELQRRQQQRRDEAKKPAFKLTSDYAALVHLNRATRLQAKGESTAIRTGVSTTEQAIGFPDGERVKAQAYKVKLANGQYRYSLIVLQRNDHFLSGKFDPVDLVIGFQDKTANITGLPVGLYTFQWVA